MLHGPLCLQLNGSSWRPARDVKTNRLLRAPLQLADNTHVVLDEALLQAGQLTALGVNNLKVKPTIATIAPTECEDSLLASVFPLLVRVAVQSGAAQ